MLPETPLLRRRFVPAVKRLEGTFPLKDLTPVAAGSLPSLSWGVPIHPVVRGQAAAPPASTAMAAILHVCREPPLAALSAVTVTPV